MKEYPILFSTEMVRAITEGRKTQTRRVIKPQPPHWEWNHYKWDDRCVNVAHPDIAEEYYVICPFGKPRDRLWVRETWAHDDPDCKDIKCGNRDHIWWKANENKIVADSFAGSARWRSPIFMPRWASRITLKIINIRADRLQKITPADVLAEGIKQSRDGYWLAPLAGVPDFPWGDARMAFSSLWNDINEKRGFGWNANPWVWVIEFEVLSS